MKSKIGAFETEDAEIAHDAQQGNIVLLPATVAATPSADLPESCLLHLLWRAFHLEKTYGKASRSR